MKTTRSLISILLIICLFAAGCGNHSSSKENAGNAGGKVKITFMHIHGGTAGEVMNKVVDDFNKKQDKIEVTPLYVDGIYEGVLEKLQALAATNQLPEITQCGYQYTNFMVENMPIVPVYKFIEEEKYDTSDYYPTVLDLGKYKDGKQYGLCIAVSNPVLYYNKDLFKAAGLDPEKPPTTFDEVRECAKKIAKDDVAGVYFDYRISGNWLFQAMVESFGGKMVADDYKSVAFDGENGVRALQYLTDLVNTDKTMPNIDNNQAMQSFTSGKLGMYVNTVAYMSALQKNAKFNVGITKFPLDGNHPRKIPGGGNNGFILKTTPEKEKAAWEFLKYLSSPEGTTAIARGMGYMAVRKSAVENENLMGKYLKVENSPAYTPYLQVDDMTQWNNFPGKGGTRIFKIVQDNIQAAIARQKTPDQALKDAAQEANGLI